MFPILPLIPILTTLAPQIGRWLGVGDTTQRAIEVVQQVVGSADPAVVQDVLNSDVGKANDIALRLAEIAKEREEIASKERIEEIKQVVSDISNARNREIATGDHWTPRLLAAFILLGFFAMIFSVLNGGVALTDPIATGLIGTLVGYVSAKADQVTSYFFGSSASSRAKDTALVNAVRRDS